MKNTYDWLVANSWRECRNQFKQYSRCFYKQFETPTRCHCNNEKFGIQIEIAITEHNGQESYEIELCGELADGTWVNLHNYALPKDIQKVVELVPRLLILWEAANSK